MPLMVGVTADEYNKVTVFSPADLAGLVGWWDASDASTFTLTSGGPAFTAWRDKSATANHLDFVTGGTRNGTINGLTSVVVPTGQRISNSVSPTTAVDNVSMFAVCRRTGGHATDCIVMCNGNVQANGYGFGIRAGSANTGFVRAAVAWHASATPDGGTTNVYSLQRAAGTWSHYVNGTVTTATSTAAPVAPSGRMTIIDTPQPFAGDLCEFIIYNVALNTTNRQQVENYLRTRWGTA